MLEEIMGAIAIYWEFPPAFSLFEPKSYTPHPHRSGFGTMCTPPIMTGEVWRGMWGGKGGAEHGVLAGLQ